jgi:1-deoxyxylulose-5-phosphate synthase
MNGDDMDYPRLGSSGLTVSRIGLGMMSYGDPDSQSGDPDSQSWALREDDAEPIVRHAADAGIIFFDTADVYSGGASEQITGRLLRRLFPRRDDYVLATKVYYPTGPGPNDRGLSRKHVLAAIDASLSRLGTDHVDLYQAHRFDNQTPVEETMAALHEVVRAGKARYIGASAMYAWQFAKAQHAAAGGLTRFISMQNRYNLVNREDERKLIPLCRDLGARQSCPTARWPGACSPEPGSAMAPGTPSAPKPITATGPPTSTSPRQSARSRPSAACPRPRSPSPGCLAGTG